MTNGPQGIQQQRGQIQIGKEKDSFERKSKKSEGEKSTRTRRKIGTRLSERYSHPSYLNQCVMGHYSKELKSFPDWSSIWTKEKNRRADVKRFRSLPTQDQKEKSIKAREYRKAKFKRDAEAYQKHKDLTNKKRRQKIKTTPSLRLLCSLRSRLYKYHKGKNSSTIRSLIGCTRDQLKRHLERKFKRGMTWDNYGSFWHIDHIIPCSAFDHTNLAQVKMCWHWTNLRPLEASANCSKGAKIENPQTSLLLRFDS
jgi:hypothetical protein